MPDKLDSGLQSLPEKFYSSSATLNMPFWALKIIFSQRKKVDFKMITWGHLGSFIALSLAIKQVLGERDVHLNSEKTNFGILEMKIAGNWVTGKFRIFHTPLK